MSFTTTLRGYPQAFAADVDKWISLRPQSAPFSVQRALIDPRSVGSFPLAPSTERE